MLSFFLEYLKRIIKHEFQIFLQPCFHQNPKQLSKLYQSIQQDKKNKPDKKNNKKLTRFLEEMEKILLTEFEKDLESICLFFSEQDEEFKNYLNKRKELLDEYITLSHSRMIGTAQSGTWIDGKKYPGIWHKTAKGKIHPARKSESHSCEDKDSSLQWYLTNKTKLLNFLYPKIGDISKILLE